MITKTNPSIIDRFKGTAGKARLIECIARQPIVAGNLYIAEEIVKTGKLIEVTKGQIIIEQGNGDDDLYFLISGSVSIVVNKREVAVRDANTQLGEMAVVDTTAVRSATILAREHCTLLKVPELSISTIACKFPELWRHIAVAVCARLRERNQFHPPPNDEPVIFIGSSSEALDAATAINTALSGKPCITKLWTEGVFQASKTTIEDLWTATRDADFAVIVLSPDDVCISRGKKKYVPRDNAIFELGLFMGALGRNRAFIVTPDSNDLKIPTDLLGVTCMRYKENSSTTLGRRLQPVSKALWRVISELGPR